MRSSWEWNRSLVPGSNGRSLVRKNLPKPAVRGTGATAGTEALTERTRPGAQGSRDLAAKIVRHFQLGRAFPATCTRRADFFTHSDRKSSSSHGRPGSGVWLASTSFAAITIADDIGRRRGTLASEAASDVQ
jgi:hypothetical protein